jgi:L-serine/L-threonine ammonia-lyase
MKPLHIKTPLIESRALSKHLGKPVELKLDALQVPESFKIRGIGLPNLPGKRCQAFYFGGNAGIAVAYAGRKLGVPVVVVVPEIITSCRSLR